MPLTQVSSRAIEDTLRYVLGASGTNHYTFTGKGLTGAVNDPTLTLSRGHTYIFENRSGGHPFYIKTSIANGGTNDAYNTGVTNNGGGNGTEIVFTVPHDAPDTLYYQCSSHSSMAGQLNIAGSVADGSITESKLADDAVTADKLANSINTAIAANTAKDLTALSASNLTSGTVPDARFPATLPAANAANLTNVPAANITGTLPAISGANLTNLPVNRLGRNLIINGAMTISQRGTSFAAADSIYMLDRIFMEKSGNAANFTVTQSSTSPDGFSKSLKFDCTLADTSTAATEFMTLRYKIEGQDLQHLGYGTSAAKATVLSFYVRSNVTGTYAVTVLQRDNSSKLYARTYTINSANTWERKTISIPADTSGVINDDNGSGFEIYFPLVLGSTYKGAGVSPTWESYTNDRFGSQHGVNLGSSTSNEWYLTGLQFEVDQTGSGVATDFEHLSFHENYLRCARYYIQATRLPVMSNRISGYVSCTSRFMPVPMRAIPSLSIDGTISFNSFFYGSGPPTSTNTPSFQNNGNAGQPYGGDNMILNFSGFGPSNVFQTNEFGEVYGTTIRINAEL